MAAIIAAQRLLTNAPGVDLRFGGLSDQG